MRYRAFGWDLGIAFQLNDDLLGIWGEDCHRQGADRRPEEEDPSGDLRLRARRRRRPGATRGAVRKRPARALTPPRSIAILERSGAREYTADQAARTATRHCELDTAGTLEREPRARLEEIISA